MTRISRSFGWTAPVALAVGLAWVGVPDPSPGSAEADKPPQKESDKAARKESANKLKQIGLAIEKYYDQHKHFPANSYDKDGKPMLSWRVRVAIFLEDDEYGAAINLGESWDSPTNKEALSKMPKVFAPPTGKKAGPGETFYQGFVGDSSYFESHKKGKLDGWGRRLADIPDGLSKTIAVVEGAKAVPWAKPDEELPFDPSRPLPKLGGLFPDGFHALFGDGYVSFIPKDVKPELLNALITRNGRENIRSDY